MKNLFTEQFELRIDYKSWTRIWFFSSSPPVIRRPFNIPPKFFFFFFYLIARKQRFICSGHQLFCNNLWFGQCKKKVKVLLNLSLFHGTGLQGQQLKGLWYFLFRGEKRVLWEQIKSYQLEKTFQEEKRHMESQAR